MRLAAAALLAAALPALAQQPATPRMAKDAEWSLRLPPQETVVFRGALVSDGGNAGAYPGLYPAPNLAGLFAAVITHAVVADSAQARQRQQAQDAADRVLTAYRAVIAGYRHQDLMQRALDKLPDGGRGRKIVPADDKPGGWVVDSVPLFTMTQDQQALIVDNAIAVHAPGAAPDKPAYQNVIRVVSRPHGHDNPDAYWNEADGAALKDQAALLLALSFDVARADAAELLGQGAPPRTFRYAEGASERIERAQLVSEQCNRIVIRNLRGWLMSVPAPQATAACPPPAADARKP